MLIHNLIFAQYLFHLINFIERMDIWKIFHVIDKLSRMNLQMIRYTFLAQYLIHTFWRCTEIVTQFLMDYAILINFVPLSHLYYINRFILTFQIYTNVNNNYLSLFLLLFTLFSSFSPLWIYFFNLAHLFNLSMIFYL